MSVLYENKYRSALALLQKGRDRLIDALTDDILDQGEDLVEEGFRFNEFLETQGTRVHFLVLLMCQLEQSADALDAEQAAPPPPSPRETPPKRRRARSRKVQQKLASEESPEDF
jgi:hypothetical protein